MHRLLRTSILITFGMLITGIIGGCSDDSPEGVTDPSNPTKSGTTSPRTDDVLPHPQPFSLTPPGGEIPPNTQFLLIFDIMGVVAVTVNDVAATGSGHNWIASLTLQEGDGQILNVSWTNRDGSSGSQVVGPYTVRVPDTTPPRITGGTVADGTIDVDPAPLNAAKIEITFDEDITGSIKLTDEAGNDLNWIGNVAGSMAWVTPIAGQELAHQTTYKIEINVADGSGNRTQVTMTFVTKPK